MSLSWEQRKEPILKRKRSFNLFYIARSINYITLCLSAGGRSSNRAAVRNGLKAGIAKRLFRWLKNLFSFFSVFLFIKGGSNVTSIEHRHIWVLSIAIQSVVTSQSVCPQGIHSARPSAINRKERRSREPSRLETRAVTLWCSVCKQARSGQCRTLVECSVIEYSLSMTYRSWPHIMLECD